MRFVEFVYSTQIVASLGCPGCSSYGGGDDTCGIRALQAPQALVQ